MPPAGGIAFATRDAGNLSFAGGADPDLVAGNRRRLSEALRIPAAWTSARQVHGRGVLDADVCAAGGVEADALTSRATGRPIAVLVADCVPIALTGPGVVAAVHAGWRGICRGVIGAAVAAMGRLPSPPVAWIGPCIGPCCYEVGPEVPAEFAAAHPGAPDCCTTLGSSRHFDLRRAAAYALEGAGAWVAGDLDPPCTRCDTRFFSHRRDATPSRQALVAWVPASG